MVLVTIPDATMHQVKVIHYWLICHLFLHCISLLLIKHDKYSFPRWRPPVACLSGQGPKILSDIMQENFWKLEQANVQHFCFVNIFWLWKFWRPSFLLINEEIYWQIITALLNRTVFCNPDPKYPDVLRPISHWALTLLLLIKAETITERRQVRMKLNVTYDADIWRICCLSFSSSTLTYSQLWQLKAGPKLRDPNGFKSDLTPTTRAKQVFTEH